MARLTLILIALVIASVYGHLDLTAPTTANGKRTLNSNGVGGNQTPCATAGSVSSSPYMLTGKS